MDCSIVGMGGGFFVEVTVFVAIDGKTCFSAEGRAALRSFSFQRDVGVAFVNLDFRKREIFVVARKFQSDVAGQRAIAGGSDEHRRDLRN